MLRDALITIIHQCQNQKKADGSPPDVVYAVAELALKESKRRYPLEEE